LCICSATKHSYSPTPVIRMFFPLASPRHRSNLHQIRACRYTLSSPLFLFSSSVHCIRSFIPAVFSVTSTIDKPRCKDVFSFPSVLCQLYCGMVQYVPIATAAFAKHVCLAWVPDFILVSCTACGLSSCGCSGSCFMLNVVHLAEHFFAIDQFSRALAHLLVLELM